MFQCVLRKIQLISRDAEKSKNGGILEVLEVAEPPFCAINPIFVKTTALPHPFYFNIAIKLGQHVF